MTGDVGLDSFKIYLVFDGYLVPIVSVDRQIVYSQRLGWRVYLLHLKQTCVQHGY